LETERNEPVSRYWKSIAAVCVVAVLASALPAQESAVRIEKGIHYLPPDRAELADLYLPPALEANKKYPGVVIIHGGGWTSG
jgi:acetyl esterase/lipase